MNSCGRRNKTMSKDEYLITDAPLKALTVFAMPMILGSFFQQVYNMADSIIVGPVSYTHLDVYKRQMIKCNYSVATVPL